MLSSPLSACPGGQQARGAGENHQDVGVDHLTTAIQAATVELPTDPIFLDELRRFRLQKRNGRYVYQSKKQRRDHIVAALICFALGAHDPHRRSSGGGAVVSEVGKRKEWG